MAVDMFLKLDKVKGESLDDKHKAEIDVLAWSWGVSNSGSAHLGGGSGAGKANFQDISVTKYIDKSTPILMKLCATGEHLAEATLTVRKAGGKNPLEYIVMTMKQVFVSSVSSGGSGGEDRLTENISLNFGSLKYAYVEQTKDGGVGEKPEFLYNIATNKEGNY